MTTVVISYNPVNGFSSGWHGDKQLFVCASDEGRGANIGNGLDSWQKASAVMHNISGRYYHGSVPVGSVQRYIVYAGLTAMDGAIEMAKGLERVAPGIPIVVAACDCHWGKKENLLRGTGIRMIRCECGGSKTLGDIARESLEASSVGSH